VAIISSGGNANVTIGGISNVAIFATTGTYIIGEVSATGNIYGGRAMILDPGAGNTAVFGSQAANIVIANTFSTSISLGGVANTIDIGSSTSNVIFRGNISASGNVTATAFVSTGIGTIRFPSITTTQRNALTAVNGDMIYNSSLNKFQGYENGAWANII
jgi:hypothetical protein